MATAAELQHQLQQRFLVAIYKIAAHGELVLKGGVALQVRTGSARYSRDLDFDHDTHRSLASLQHTIRRAIKQAASGAGLEDLQVSESKQTDSVARWKIHARSRDGTPIGLTIEVSRRHPLDLAQAPSTPFQPENRQLPRVLVDVYSEPALLAQKIRALLDPNRVAPRDVYDLDILVGRQAELAPAACAAILELHPDASDLLWRKLEICTWSRFRDEVIPALPPAEQVRLNEEAFDAIKLRVGERIGQWLDSAAANPK